MKLSFFVVLALLVVCAGGWYLFSQNVTNSMATGNSIHGVVEQGVRTFELTGDNFRFLEGKMVAPELHVKEGENVRVVFTSTEGFHD